VPEYTQLREYLQEYFYSYFLSKIRSKKESRLASARKSGKKERKVIFKIFRHLQLKDLLKNKYSIESQMDYVEKSMKGLGFAITHEAIFKYYLAFL
jgi:transposase